MEFTDKGNEKKYDMIYCNMVFWIVLYKIVLFIILYITKKMIIFVVVKNN